MTVRIRYKIDISVSSTSAEEKDLGNVAYEVLHDASGEGGSRKMLLEGGAVDELIGLNQITTTRFVLIRTSSKDPTLALGLIEIKLNSPTGEVIEVAPLPGASEAHLLLVSSGLTEIYASNPGTSDVDVIVVAVGD